MTTKFKIGTTYEHNFIGDSAARVFIKIEKRTAKSVWIKAQNGDIERRAITIRDDVEQISPNGRYSMSPILRASKPVGQGEVIEKALSRVKNIIPAGQLAAIREACRGEEAAWFLNRLEELYSLFVHMPQTYEQDGMGDKAVATLHYFTGSCDWHITEKDMSREQHQAFGLANLGYGAELGYISLVELSGVQGVELDLHFTPATLGEIKQQRSAA